MVAALAESLIATLLGLRVGPAGQDPNNRFSVEGLTMGAAQDGVPEIGIRKIEAASLRLASGSLVMEVGRIVLHDLRGKLRVDAGVPRLDSLQAAGAELSAVKLQGPLVLPDQAGPSDAAWSLVPLAAADGTLRAQIVDAHLIFDADVTVPIRQGLVRFNDAKVEHVGPDSRMGVSRMGLYVDAPNGRSYLYQFPAAPVAGVEFERRGAMRGPWSVSDRGSLRLQPFGEGMLRQGPIGHGLGLTEQARMLFERTAVKGDVQLGDGRFAGAGMQADLWGRSERRNAVHVHSDAVGRGVTAQIASLSVRNASLQALGLQLACDDVAGSLTLRLLSENKQLRFALDVPTLKLSGLRVHPSVRA